MNKLPSIFCAHFPHDGDCVEQTDVEADTGLDKTGLSLRDSNSFP